MRLRFAGAGEQEPVRDRSVVGAQNVLTDPAEVAGIPEDVLEAAREAAKETDAEGWKFTLHAPSYLPVLQYKLFILLFPAYVLGLLYFRERRDIRAAVEGGADEQALLTRPRTC